MTTTTYTAPATARLGINMQRYVKPVIFLACLLPLAWLIWKAQVVGLGANPIEKISRYTGDWTLRLLLITLAITPLRTLFGWQLVRYRRMLGLFTFFYGCLHFLNWLAIDHFFDFAEITKDIAKRPYVTVGFTAFVLLVPLAVTSTNAMIKRLGRNWKRLHQTVYVIAMLGVVHYLWLVKADNRDPLFYGLILMLLLGVRAWDRVSRPRRQSAATAMRTPSV
jgi:sulfoxide reductase heme-binding subunit YedZ